MTLTQQELLRYSRHFSLNEFDVKSQERLKISRVLCVGAGGLGSPLLLYLAAAGIGTLGIIDNDVVDLSNLQRQILYGSNDINIKKTVVAQQKLADINPHTNIITHDTSLEKDNAFDIISKYDIIADCTDNFPARYLINDIAFQLNKPDVFASIFQFEGQCSVFCSPTGPCYRCLYEAPPPPGLIPNCAEGGVLGVLPGLLGVIQATEVIKLILNIGKPLIGSLLTVNALTMEFRHFNININPDCILCGKHQDFASLPRYQTKCSANVTHIEQISAADLQKLLAENAVFLLDVREPYEYEICNLGGYLIPIKELPNRLNEIPKNKTIVVHCKAGARGEQAVKLLKQVSNHKVMNLTGGILAWIKNIDSSLTYY